MTTQQGRPQKFMFCSCFLNKNKKSCNIFLEFFVSIYPVITPHMGITLASFGVFLFSNFTSILLRLVFLILQKLLLQWSLQKKEPKRLQGPMRRRNSLLRKKLLKRVPSQNRLKLQLRSVSFLSM